MRIRPDAVVNWCNQAVSKIPNAGKSGLKLGANYGLEDSQKLVHVITGRLKRSGGIKEETEDRVTYGYDAPYAGDEEFGNSRRPAHPYITPGYRTLASGLAADYVFLELQTLL